MEPGCFTYDECVVDYGFVNYSTRSGSFHNLPQQQHQHQNNTYEQQPYEEEASYQEEAFFEEDDEMTEELEPSRTYPNRSKRKSWSPFKREHLAWAYFHIYKHKKVGYQQRAEAF